MGWEHLYFELGTTKKQRRALHRFRIDPLLVKIMSRDQARSLIGLLVEIVSESAAPSPVVLVSDDGGKTSKQLA